QAPSRKVGNCQIRSELVQISVAQLPLYLGVEHPCPLLSKLLGYTQEGGSPITECASSQCSKSKVVYFVLPNLKLSEVVALEHFG
ncbi:hypothetical protein, partial [Vibrio crassostreae]|uniref:hypothetical protein n=1 Tax=Vibrio crassostreae TaxID=246167 RepID=UPI001B314FA2